MEKKGTVYFFTGLAGAGKTTIGGLFYRRLKAKRNDVLLLDGDMTRLARGESDYSTEGRLASCRRGMGMIKLDWYRANIENYREVYVKVSMETLFRRDQKGLYSSGARQVVGIDLPYDEPEHPDVVIVNDGSETPEQIVDRLEAQLGLP